MRIAWRTVGRIIGRTMSRRRSPNLLEGLEHIGIDELSYRRHHEYVTVVVDHVSQRVVWTHEGKNAATLGRFFDDLGPERAALLKTATLNMSTAYIDGVDINTIRAWLGHVSLDTTNRYAEADLEMKAKALEKCAVSSSDTERKPTWRTDKNLRAFLSSL